MSPLALEHTFQLPPKPALQSDEHSGVCGHRWTLWSQVRGTSLCYLAPLSVCSYVYLLLPVSQSALASAIPTLIRGFCLQHADFMELKLACPCLHVLPQVLSLLCPASLLSDFSLGSSLYSITSSTSRLSVPGSFSSPPL